MQRGSAKHSPKAVEVGGITIVVIVTTAVEEENDEDIGPLKWMHTKQTVARPRPTANEPTARSAVFPHLVTVAMSVETVTVIVAGTVTLTVPVLETQTDVKTNASACTALVAIPVEVVMSLTMAAVLSATLVVWPVVTAVADVTVILRVWLAGLLSGTDVIAGSESAARVREPPDGNGQSSRKKRTRMRRRTRRRFTLAARKERLKRSRRVWMGVDIFIHT
jgi:hypothetical protein